MNRKNIWNIGIMQGRLTVPKGRGIQFFPFENWKEEFKLAKKLNLDEIEFIFDYDNYEQNPIWYKDGEEIKNIVLETGVQVHAVCFDYFMRRPFFKAHNREKKFILEENEKVLLKVLTTMEKLKIQLLEIPLVDQSSLKTEEEQTSFQEFLNSIINKIDNSIQIGLETDLPPKIFKDYIKSFDNDRIGANYDSGNSSGLGYDPYEEIVTLQDSIFNIHIKDRIYQGKSVVLGKGSANFDKMFQALKVINYQGSFILQAARKQDGLETEAIQEQKHFVEKYLEILKK